MKSKFKKLMAAALVLCLVLALLPVGVLADNTHSIKLEFDNKFGSATVDKSTANSGETVTVTSVPQLGYYTASVKYSTDGNSQGVPALRVNGTNDYQFTMPDSDVTVTVSYGATSASNITIVENENCTITTDPAGTAFPDQTVKINVSDLESGYSVDKYSVITDDGMGGIVTVKEDGTFIMPQAPVKVSVTLTYTEPVMYSVTCEADETGGKISADAASYEAGDTVTVTAIPDEGYQLNRVWAEGTQLDLIVEAAIVGNIATFTMPNDDVTVRAEFELIPVVETYSINCVPAEHGELFQDNTRYQEGDIVKILYSPNPGYQLASMRAFASGEGGHNLWNEDITATQSFEMPGYNVIVVATFVKVADTYTIGTNVTGNGTVNVSPASTAAAGDWVTVTATPFEGYKLALLNYSFDGHTLTPVKIESGVAFPMPAHNITVNAVFVPVSGEYAINVTTDGGCTVSQPVSAAYGDYVTIDIYMNAGHHLYNVYLDKELVTDDVYWYNGQWHYSFYMPNHDVDIYVTTTTKYFVNPVYNIDGGAVEVWVKDAGGWDSTIFADKGDWVCFKVSPYSGYELGSVSVIGRWSNQSYDVHYNKYDGCYYFKMPGESVDLSVSFVDGQHRVYVKDVSNGSLTANVNWAAEGDKVYVTAKPSKGYELTWLSVKAADGTVLKIYEALGENTYYFYMPDQYVTVSGIFSLISSGLPFVDVNSGAWYYDAVSFVYNKGIMNGVTSTTFEPNSTITRGMVVTMLWRMAGEPYVSGGSFSDVASGRYYSTAVAWAAKNGIVDGYSSTVFGVNDPVTREQFATILYRYAKYMGYSATGSSLTGYYDANSVSSWARDAMGWAVKNGIITGSGNSRLNPTGTASRAEVAQMFMSFYEFTT